MNINICLKLLTILAVVSAKSLTIPTEKKIHQHILSDNSALPLFPIDHDGLYYVTNITIGTPPQLFTVSFSNFIKESFVPSIECDFCLATNEYNESKSSTYKSTNNVLSMELYNTVDTRVVGSYSFDTFHIGNNAVQNQVFCDVTTELNYDLPVDGMISLAYNKENIVFSMHSQGLISDPIVGYFISDTDGEISFGISDINHYSGDMNYFNLSIGPFWTLPIDNFFPKYDHFKMNLNNGYQADFDVAEANIESSPATIKIINLALGAELEKDGSYIFDCNKLYQYPPFTFVFSGLPYVLDPKDYIQMKDDKCISYFVSNNIYDDGIFSIGQPFFRKYYTLFDFGNQRIGFATAI